jgi:hypothetical protein
MNSTCKFDQDLRFTKLFDDIVKKSTKYQILATKDRETSWKEIEVQRINI